MLHDYTTSTASTVTTDILKQLMTTTNPAPNNDDSDLLAELRAKTASLAKSVRGKDEPEQKHLHVQSDGDDETSEIDDLKVPTPAPEIQNDKESTTSQSHARAAVDLVRGKVAKLYSKEPDAETELLEAEAAGDMRSKHQQYMYDLSTSGKSLAEVQTEWHNYYTSLPDSEKHEVWQEFYADQKKASQYAKAQNVKDSSPVSNDDLRSTAHTQTAPEKPLQQSPEQIKSQLLNKVSANGKLKPIHHFKSLLFGLGLASVVGLIITFTFFNEVFIAPFISPSQNVSATPIIGPSDGEVGPESKIIIPKINLEVPVVFGINSIEEDDIQDALEDGVVHYATTPNPGEKGNSVIVGHSSNNILNSGKYKFAFVLLRRLENEDIFYVQNEGVRYTYEVYKKEVVGPSEVSVLDTQERANTMTLITCDPPGTSVNRLIITAEQIDPDPSTNTASTAPPLDEIEGASEDAEELPSNAPSLWSRIWPF